MAEAALAGIRVLEVGNFMAAPFCTLQLADLGADVVKIENPDGGDQVRTTAPFLDGESSSFGRPNRNKRSLALDLKSREGKEVFRRLIRRADVVVENLRPGTMADLELDYPRLSELNPRLVFVAASGWGQDGPYAQRPGLDIMAQGMSGLMSITGEEGGKAPVKIGVPVTDLTCTLLGATTTRNWEACCDVFGLAGLKQDPRFVKNHVRHQNRHALIPLIEDVTKRRPARHWVEALERAGVPCGLLQTYDQVFNDPHLNARGFFPDAPHTKLGPVKQV